MTKLRNIGYMRFGSKIRQGFAGGITSLTPPLSLSLSPHQSCVEVCGLCGCSSRSCLNYSMDAPTNLPFAGKIKRNTGKEMGQKVLSA